MAAADSTSGTTVDADLRARDIDEQTATWQVEALDAVDAHAGEFTAGLRPAARRRRFVRSSTTPLPDDTFLPTPSPARAAAAPSSFAPGSAATSPADVRAPATAWRDAVPADVAPSVEAPRRDEQRAEGIEGMRRLIDRQHAMLVELGALSNRVIEASERATRETDRADRAEAELAGAQQRLLAARGLVGEAQKTARVAAERAAFVEGRADALQSALDEALHGGWWARRRLRRTHA